MKSRSVVPSEGSNLFALVGKGPWHSDEQDILILPLLPFVGTWAVCSASQALVFPTSSEKSMSSSPKPARAGPWWTQSNLLLGGCKFTTTVSRLLCPVSLSPFQFIWPCLSAQICGNRCHAPFSLQYCIFTVNLSRDPWACSGNTRGLPILTNLLLSTRRRCLTEGTGWEPGDPDQPRDRRQMLPWPGQLRTACGLCLGSQSSESPA